MVANAERGEVSLVVDGTRYVLTITLTAMMELEDLSGKTFAEVLSRLPQQHIADLAWLMWTALRTHHPDIATDQGEPKAILKGITRFMDAAGGLTVINAQLEVLNRLHAQPAELQTAGGDGRPPDSGAASSASPGDGSALKVSAAA
jgi:Phage tail tube protein, GTA-gp10